NFFPLENMMCVLLRNVEKTMSNNEERPDDSLLVGVPAIQKAVNEMFNTQLTQRQVRYQLDKRRLRAGRLGSQHITTKKQLGQGMLELIGAETLGVAISARDCDRLASRRPR